LYLSVCAIYRNEGPYLREWVEFHRLVGVERFFLYDNRSTDDHRAALAPLVEEGVVSITEWPEFPGQISAYEHCLAQHGDESRWIAFIDIDEFLYSPTTKPVPEILAELEQYPGIGVNRVRFGTSGHKTPPAGLVIENYVRRAPRLQYLVKSIVDPKRTLGPETVHVFTYRDGPGVDERGRPLVFREAEPPADAPPALASYTETFAAARLRINHHATRSEEEFRRKAERPQADTGRPLPLPVERILENFNRTKDEALLRYAPAVRERMQMPPEGDATSPAPSETRRT
jgi:Glycosyltransferase family 92